MASRPVLTDAVAAQIIREAIAPRFRERRYADGLGAGRRRHLCAHRHARRAGAAAATPSG